jgi:hypothetical protein
MKELKELRHEVLNLRNMGELTKQTESILLHKLNALQEAIDHIHFCTELKPTPPSNRVVKLSSMKAIDTTRVEGIPDPYWQKYIKDKQ